MYRLTLPAAVAIAVAISTLSPRVHAAVVIIANRTQSALRFETLAESANGSAQAKPKAARGSDTGLVIDLSLVADVRSRQYALDPGELVSIPLGKAPALTVRGRSFGSYELRPYGVYYVGTSKGGQPELREIGFDRGLPVRQRPGEMIAAQGDMHAALDEKDGESRRVIGVAVYSDEDERAAEQVWKKRLQDRIAEASKILERCCGMKLAIKAFGTWRSDNAINEFELSLREFERTVKPEGGLLAIGFTSQYELAVGRTHLGGTRGPLHSHILLREWSQHVSETERLELLVHELGHHLGAVHSPERGSVMRPVLGDRQARARAFRIAPDPVNALAMSVVGEEISERGITSFAQLSGSTRSRLAAIYTTLAEAMPNDPAAHAYLQFVGKMERPH